MSESLRGPGYVKPPRAARERRGFFARRPVGAGETSAERDREKGDEIRAGREEFEARGLVGDERC